MIKVKEPAWNVTLTETADQKAAWRLKFNSWISDILNKLSAFVFLLQSRSATLQDPNVRRDPYTEGTIILTSDMIQLD